MKMSDTLRQRIEETESDIATLDMRRAALTAEKQTLLASPTVDATRLAKIEHEESRIPSTLDSLRMRCTLLADQVQEALKTEAHERVHEIEQERTAIAARINERRAAFLAGVEQLLLLVKEDSPERQRAAELQAESGYLHEAFGAPWPHVPTAVPLNQNDLNKLEAEFRQSHWLVHAGHAWQAKTNEVIQGRARDERAALEKQRQHGHSRFVRMSVPDFTPGMKG